MKKLLFFLSIIPFLWIAGCDDDDDGGNPAQTAEAPEITASQTTFNYKIGDDPSTITFSVEVDGGYASGVVSGSPSGTVSIVSQPSVGDDDGTVELSYTSTTEGEDTFSFIVTDQQALALSDTVQFTISVAPEDSFDAPTVSTESSTIVEDLGTAITIDIAVTIEGGFASSEATTSGSGTVEVTQDLSPGDTSGTVTLTYNAAGRGDETITFIVTDGQDPALSSEPLEISVTSNPPIDSQFENPYDFISGRPEFSDTRFLIDKVGQQDLYTDLANGGIDAETFFFYADGWLDDFIANSPFIESRETMTNGQAALLAGMFRSQQRDNDATAPLFRNNLAWESLTSPTDENVDLTALTGSEVIMNVRNRGIIGNPVIQSLGRPFAYVGDVGSAQLGTVDTEGTPTFTANELMVNVKVSLTDTVSAANGTTIPYGIIHAFDGFPADIDAAFADPQGYQETVQGRLRNYRDVSIVQNLLLVDPDVKWTMNAIEDNVTNYSGSSGMYGVVIMSASVFDDLNTIISAIDPAFAFGETRTTVNWGDVRSVWNWDQGAGHIPEAVYSAAADYWFKHWIPTEDIEADALADGDHTNFAGETISVSAGTMTLGSTTVNIVNRMRYQDQRVGRWDRIDDGTFSPSEGFVTTTGDNGYKWVEIIVVDGSFD